MNERCPNENTISNDLEQRKEDEKKRTQNEISLEKREGKNKRTKMAEIPGTAMDLMMAIFEKRNEKALQNILKRKPSPHDNTRVKVINDDESRIVKKLFWIASLYLGMFGNST